MICHEEEEDQRYTITDPDPVRDEERRDEEGQKRRGVRILPPRPASFNRLSWYYVRNPKLRMTSTYSTNLLVSVAAHLYLLYYKY